MTGPAVPGWDAAIPRRLDELAPGHWLKVNGLGLIDGCQCGFAANMTDYDYGDEVVAHIVTAALAAALPLVLAALEAEIRAKVTYSDEEDDALDFVCRFVATYRKGTGA